MINGSAAVEFGSGSTASVAGVDDRGIGAIFMRSASPGKIGDTTRFSKEDWEMVQDNPEVVMFFTNIECVDNFMRQLTDLRQLMLEVADKNKEEAE